MEIQSPRTIAHAFARVTNRTIHTISSLSGTSAAVTLGSVVKFGSWS